MSESAFPSALTDMATGYASMTDKELQALLDRGDRSKLFADIRAMAAAIAVCVPKRYNNGKFITWREGMGESGFGTVIEDMGQTVSVNYYQGAAHTIAKSDIIGPSTPEDADAYSTMRQAVA